MSWAEPSRLPSGGRRSAHLPTGGVGDPVGQVRVAAGDPLEPQRQLDPGHVARRTRLRAPAASIPSGTATVPSCSVASSAIGAQAYSRSNRRLSPSLANRLRIGFAIGFAVLTAMAVIGVGRFIQQRQDFEDSIARSYQVEMVARVRIARGQRRPAARARRSANRPPPRRTAGRNLQRHPRHRPARRRRADRRPDRGAAPLQRPDLLDAPPAGGAGRRGRAPRRRRPQRPGRGRRPGGDGDPRRRLQRDGRGARAGGEPARTNSTASKTSSSSPPRTSCAAR